MCHTRNGTHRNSYNLNLTLMKMEKRTKRDKGLDVIYLITTVQIALIVLYCTGLIEWPVWVVLLPMFVVAVCGMIFLLIACVAAAIMLTMVFIKRRKGNDSKNNTKG